MMVPALPRHTPPHHHLPQLSPPQFTNTQYYVPSHHRQYHPSSHFTHNSPHYPQPSHPALSSYIPRSSQSVNAVTMSASAPTVVAPHSPNPLPTRRQSLVSLDGMVSREDFEKILDAYINKLSPKKRDKALILHKRYLNIQAVLKEPKCTTIESAQFRFWAKKMFRLNRMDDGHGSYTDIVCHEGKPVAVRERLYDILTRCHDDAGHGGRDKTSLQVRKSWSWVPKELIARFVQNCPTCQQRRSSPGDFAGAMNNRTPLYDGHRSVHSGGSSPLHQTRAPSVSMPPQQVIHYHPQYSGIEGAGYLGLQHPEDTGQGMRTHRTASMGYDVSMSPRPSV